MTTNDRERPEQQLLETLREQTQVLLHEIPGPLRKVSVSSGDSQVTVEWAEGDATAGARAAAAVVGGAAADGAGDGTGEAPDGTVAITAPLVGTFYRRPEPGADPFVESGSLVEAGQTVAIIEAMKLMNPVKAPEAGKVSAIHPRDGEMVEFNQPLVTLEPQAS